MLVALLTIMLMGGGSSVLNTDIQFVEEQLKMVMDKTDERKAALATLNEMTKRTQQRQKTLGKIQKQQKKLVADYGSSPEDTDKLWLEVTAERSEFHADMIKLRFELKEQLGREVWCELFPSN